MMRVGGTKPLMWGVVCAAVAVCMSACGSSQDARAQGGLGTTHDFVVRAEAICRRTQTKSDAILIRARHIRFGPSARARVAVALEELSNLFVHQDAALKELPVSSSEAPDKQLILTSDSAGFKAVGAEVQALKTGNVRRLVQIVKAASTAAAHDAALGRRYGIQVCLGDTPPPSPPTAVVAKRGNGLNSFLVSPVDDSALTEGKRHRQRSARAFAGGGSVQASRSAVAVVAADGFVESEDETLIGGSGDPTGFTGTDGYSNVIKFASASGARRYLGYYIASGRPRPQIRVSRFSMPGVPSGTGTAWVKPVTSATVTNVFWVSGRCLVHIGEISGSHFPLRSFESTLNALAKSVYDRSNGRCT
jgi:hypothetical protein